MSMTKFALFGLVLSLIRASSEWHLTKCCPSGEIFLRNSTKCVSKPGYEIEIYSHYLNITREFQGIPQCNESDDLITTPLDDLESNTILEEPACLETLYELPQKKTIIIVHCRANKTLPIKTINASFAPFLHIRKCCFGDTIFDSRKKTCVTRLSESHSLGTFLLNRSADADGVMIATHGPPKCKGPIVNYEVNENDIFIRNSIYTVSVPMSTNNVKEEPLTEDNACLEMTPDFALKQRLIVRVCRDPEFCDTNACIRKCCSEDEYLYTGYGCNKFIPNEPREFHNAFANAVKQTSSTFDTTKGYGVLIQFPCKVMYGFNDSNEWGKYMLLTSNGHVSVLNDDTNNKHCFEVMHNKCKNSSDFYLFTCDKYNLMDIYRSADWWFAILVVKCVFLLLTLLVYAYLPNLQNIHGKTVICYLSSLLLDAIISFISDWYNKVAIEKREKISCKAFAYIAFFLSQSRYFWLNVMCFDIWQTFGTLHENTIINNRKKRKRFLLYCLYSWGITFLLSIFIIVVDNTDILPEYLELDIDYFACRLTYTANWNNYSDLIFGYGPQTILLISNMVFFILTSKYYNKVKADIKNVITDPRSKQLHSSRKRFIMTVKLFIVMGMQWIFDIVNYFIEKCLGFDYHWTIFSYITIVYYSLEGLLIFIIFVLKKSMYQAIWKRL